MKGTDVPQSEIRLAEKFLRITQHGKMPERWITTRKDFVTMMAWYALIRKNGDGSGTFVSRKTRKATEPEGAREAGR